MPTRVVHRVRCRKKEDSQTWADVKVVDAFTVLAPGGKSQLLWTRAKDAIPHIVDNTGDKNGVDNSSPTRVSHMERVHSEDDPSQKFDIEILDACAFQPPHVGSGDQSAALEDATKRDGLPKAATFGHGPFAVFLPDKDSIKFTVDKTGLGLGSGSGGSASRSGHVNLVTEKGNTDKKTDGLQDAGDSVPPHILDWCATIKTDAINFKAPHGANILLYMPISDQDEKDTTKEVKDPDTGESVPPDNTDPNKYVCFPADDTADRSTGLSVGIPVHDTGGEKKPISQGPLWWIERISPSFKPWFWYCDVNTPQAFSFFGNGGSGGGGGSWAWRGFVLWNFYPVIWILSVNNALVPLGTFGSPSLELCAEAGDWDFSSNPVPGATFLAPGRPPGSTVQFPFSALDISGAGLQFENDAGPQVFAPFGLLSMTHAPLGKPPDAMPYGITEPGDELWDGRPNIWQLTGLPQPARSKPGEPFDPVTNAFPPPTQKKAEEAARLFETNWNAVTKGHNDFIQANYVGTPSTPRAVYTTPPGWNWAVPFFDAFLGNVGGDILGYHAAFQNGIPPGIATHSLPLEVYAPATTYTIKVDQLDPKKWDTSKLEYFKHPEKYGLGQFEPPVTYESEKK